MTNRIRELREAKGLTQQELALLVGVGIGAVSRWENGHDVPRQRMAKTIAKRLNVTVDELNLSADKKG